MNFLTTNTNRIFKILIIFKIIIFSLSSPLVSAEISRTVSELDMPEIYCSPDDMSGIAFALKEYGLVVIKNVYSAESMTAIKNHWDIFMGKFNNIISSPEIIPTYTEYGTHFYDGLRVNRYVTYATDNFTAYKFGEGRYEIRFSSLENNFVDEDILTPLSMKNFLKEHFFISEDFKQTPSYVSFYGLLPSLPGNLDGNLHRDTGILESDDIDGTISTQFSKAFYLTSILAIGHDPGSTEFYLGSHKMTSQKVKDLLAKGQITLVKPQMNEGDVKLFDGRIGHRGVANPIGGDERKGIYGVHHASWYTE